MMMKATLILVGQIMGMSRLELVGVTESLESLVTLLVATVIT